MKRITLKVAGWTLPLSPLAFGALAAHLSGQATSQQHLNEAIQAIAGLKRRMDAQGEEHQEPPSFLAVAADPKPFRRTRLAKVRRSKAEKRSRRAAIREKVFARAAERQGYERCEGPQLSGAYPVPRCNNPAEELAHAFGKGKGRMPESERTCLALCRVCHRDETNNRPSGAYWWEHFAGFFRRQGFVAEADAAQRRCEFEKTRAALPVAPKRDAHQERLRKGGSAP